MRELQKNHLLKTRQHLEPLPAFATQCRGSGSTCRRVESGSRDARVPGACSRTAMCTRSRTGARPVLWRKRHWPRPHRDMKSLTMIMDTRHRNTGCRDTGMHAATALVCLLDCRGWASGWRWTFGTRQAEDSRLAKQEVGRVESMHNLRDQSVDPLRPYRGPDDKRTRRRHIHRRRDVSAGYGHLQQLWQYPLLQRCNDGYLEKGTKAIGGQIRWLTLRGRNNFRLWAKRLKTARSVSFGHHT